MDELRALVAKWLKSAEGYDYIVDDVGDCAAASQRKVCADELGALLAAQPVPAEGAQGDNEISITISGREQVALALEALRKAGYVTRGQQPPATAAPAEHLLLDSLKDSEQKWEREGIIPPATSAPAAAPWFCRYGVPCDNPALFAAHPPTDLLKELDGQRGALATAIMFMRCTPECSGGQCDGKQTTCECGTEQARANCQEILDAILTRAKEGK
jgi:hypothetical protein